MRRRLVDLGLTAVGAAALLGLIKALPLLAAFITLPTTWTAGQILTSSDLNAEFASVLAQVNGNLDDTNIVAGAAIKGSKLAVFEGAGHGICDERPAEFCKEVLDFLD